MYNIQYHIVFGKETNICLLHEMLASWVASQRELIDIERECESAMLEDKISTLSAKECQTSGLSILNLEIESISHALFGRCSVVLQRMDKKLIQNAFKVGDEVTLYNPKLSNGRIASKRGSSSKSNDKPSPEDSATVFGIVSKTLLYKVTIIVDEIDDNKFDAPLRLDIRPSQKTFNKMIETVSISTVATHMKHKFIETFH